MTVFAALLLGIYTNYGVSAWLVWHASQHFLLFKK